MAGALCGRLRKASPNRLPVVSQTLIVTILLLSNQTIFRRKDSANATCNIQKVDSI